MGLTLFSFFKWQALYLKPVLYFEYLSILWSTLNTKQISPYQN